MLERKMSQIIKSLGAVTAIKALIAPTLALSIRAHLTRFQLLFSNSPEF